MRNFGDKINMPPGFTLDKIKFATDRPTFERAVDLYESGKIIKFKEDLSGFFAVVLGTKPYRVFVSSRHYNEGDCECYLGQNETLCKHMVAVAIYAIKKGQPLEEEDKKLVSNPACSGRLGKLSPKELAEAKKAITAAMRYIKPYNGPSRIWFAYQNSLSEGCNRLAAIISELPVGEQTAGLIVDLLLRLDRKLRGGVDDSDGTVGGFMEETVNMLQEYFRLEPGCLKAFYKLVKIDTCFGWEESLVKLVDDNH